MKSQNNFNPKAIEFTVSTQLKTKAGGFSIPTVVKRMFDIRSNTTLYITITSSVGTFQRLVRMNSGNEIYGTSKLPLNNLFRSGETILVRLQPSEGLLTEQLKTEIVRTMNSLRPEKSGDCLLELFNSLLEGVDTEEDEDHIEYLLAQSRAGQFQDSEKYVIEEAINVHRSAFVREAEAV